MVACSPALGELGDEQQTAAAFVESAGPSQMRAVLLLSDTSQMSTVSWIRRSWTGGRP